MSSTIIPCLRYRDAPGMMVWLEQAFGFEPNVVVEDGAGGIAHAQLKLGTGMVMIGSVRDDAFGRLQAVPAALGGTTQSPYVVVPDADLAYARATAAGAEIVIEIADQDHGGRFFACRDPEGHLWNVGSYDPWAATA